MAKAETDTVGETGAGAASPTPRRINVAVTPDMLAAIDRVIEREGVTLTEAVRRLIGYGDLMYRSVREKKESVIFRGEDGKEREVILV